MKTFDAQYDCMRDYLLYKGFKEVSPYVFEETKEIIDAVINAPDYAKEGAGTWKKDIQEYNVMVTLTKSEKEELVAYCKEHNLQQCDVIKQALKLYYMNQK